MLVKFIIAVYLIQFSRVKSEEGNYDCDSEIYCQGDLLQTVQLSELFKSSSRQFVDMKLKNSPSNILNEFKNLKKNDINELSNFVQRNFEEDKVDTCELKDFKETPDFDKFIITDVKYKEFYIKISQMWKNLAVKTPKDVKTNSDHHSMIYLPNCYIKNVESDSMPQPIQTYMIVRGLLSNDMLETAKGIIRNYAYMIKKFKFSLYTNRVYASTRTQLPLFAEMVLAYLQVDFDKNFLQEMLPSLRKEFDWWTENRMVVFTNYNQQHKLFRYYQSSLGPRPEEYKLDSDLIKNLETRQVKKYFSETRCANESGLNFSSRFMQEDRDYGKRWNLDVSHIIPVELNTILHKYAGLLSNWYKQLNEKTLEKKYKELSVQIGKSISQVLWNDDLKMWVDFNLIKNESLQVYYATNFMPIFTGTYGFESGEVENIILNYLADEELIDDTSEPNYRVIPTSKRISEEISDYPFGSLIWNIFAIEGMSRTKSKLVQEMAVKWASTVIRTSYEVFTSHGILPETYKTVFDNLIENENEDTEHDEVKKTSVAALGGITTLLKLFGQYVSHTDLSYKFTNIQKEIERMEM